MTPAEFKTIREAVGLSVSEAAALFNVKPRSVQYWESGRSKVPDGVADTVAGMDKQLDMIANEALRLYWEQTPDQVVLYRYQSTEALHEAQVGFNSWPVGVHAAMLYRAKRLFDHNNIPCAIEYI